MLGEEIVNAVVAGVGVGKMDPLVACFLPTGLCCRRGRLSLSSCLLSLFDESDSAYHEVHGFCPGRF